MAVQQRVWLTNCHRRRRPFHSEDKVPDSSSIALPAGVFLQINLFYFIQFLPVLRAFFGEFSSLSSAFRSKVKIIKNKFISRLTFDRRLR